MAWAHAARVREAMPGSRGDTGQAKERADEQAPAALKGSARGSPA